MTTTKEQISRWFDHGITQNATYMIVACDTFDWEDYPVYVKEHQNIHEVYAQYNNKDMQKVMEVYDLRKDKEVQLNTYGVFSLPPKENKEISLNSSEICATPNSSEIYALVRIQDGIGCDYTIGCGVQIDLLESKTYNSAIEEAEDFLKGDPEENYEECSLIGETHKPFYKKVYLVKIEEDLPIDKWYKDVLDFRNNEKKLREDRKERKKYEELKKKFEGKL